MAQVLQVLVRTLSVRRLLQSLQNPMPIGLLAYMSSRAPR